MLHPDRRDVYVEIPAGVLYDLAAVAGGYTHSAGKYINQRAAINRANEILDRIWNPDHDQYANCAQCDHAYARHFDSYEDMEPIGCKYCHCQTFQDKDYS